MARKTNIYVITKDISPSKEDLAQALQELLAKRSQVSRAIHLCRINLVGEFILSELGRVRAGLSENILNLKARLKYASRGVNR